MKRKTWKEFQESKLLWWVNRTLHLFGWAIVLCEEEDGTISDCYPARITFRGFPEKLEEEGFVGLTKYLANEASLLLRESTSSSADSPPSA